MKLKTFCKAILPALAVLCLLAWDSPLPRLFLIGDSISIQYGPYLEKYLQEAARFERKQDNGQAEKKLDVPTGANGGDSRMVLAYLRARINDPAFRPDYLLLNCGLHDIKHLKPEGRIQVNKQEYRENLEAIIDLLRQKGIQLIWMRTTPVVDSIHNARSKNFKRYAADVRAYNRIADEVCAANNVAVIDLFSFTTKLGIEQYIDHVHYKEPARTLQAAFIAGFLRRHLMDAIPKTEPGE